MVYGGRAKSARATLNRQERSTAPQVPQVGTPMNNKVSRSLAEIAISFLPAPTYYLGGKITIEHKRSPDRDKDGLEAWTGRLYVGTRWELGRDYHDTPETHDATVERVDAELRAAYPYPYREQDYADDD